MLQRWALPAMVAIPAGQCMHCIWGVAANGVKTEGRATRALHTLIAFVIFGLWTNSPIPAVWAPDAGTWTLTLFSANVVAMTTMFVFFLPIHWVMTGRAHSWKWMWSTIFIQVLAWPSFYVLTFLYSALADSQLLWLANTLLAPTVTLLESIFLRQTSKFFQYYVYQDDAAGDMHETYSFCMCVVQGFAESVRLVCLLASTVRANDGLGDYSWVQGAFVGLCVNVLQRYGWSRYALSRYLPLSKTPMYEIMRYEIMYVFTAFRDFFPDS